MVLRPVLSARARPFWPASAWVAVASKNVPKVVATRLRAFGGRMPRGRGIASESFAQLLRNSVRHGFGIAFWTRSAPLRNRRHRSSGALRVPTPAAGPASTRPPAQELLKHRLKMAPQQSKSMVWTHFGDVWRLSRKGARVGVTFEPASAQVARFRRRVPGGEAPFGIKIRRRKRCRPKSTSDRRPRRPPCEEKA